MVEKDYYAKAKKYYTETAKNNMAIELKITKTDYLNFRCLPPHQEEDMLKSERAFAHKIADAGKGKKPFDIFLLYKATPVLVAIYYKPNATQIFELPLRSFIHKKYQKWAKSLHIDEAALIGKRIYL